MAAAAKEAGGEGGGGADGADEEQRQQLQALDDAAAEGSSASGDARSQSAESGGTGQAESTAQDDGPAVGVSADEGVGRLKLRPAVLGSLADHTNNPLQWQGLNVYGAADGPGGIGGAGGADGAFGSDGAASSHDSRDGEQAALPRWQNIAVYGTVGVDDGRLAVHHWAAGVRARGFATWKRSVWVAWRSGRRRASGAGCVPPSAWLAIFAALRPFIAERSRLSQLLGGGGRGGAAGPASEPRVPLALDSSATVA